MCSEYFHLIKQRRRPISQSVYLFTNRFRVCERVRVFVVFSSWSSAILDLILLPLRGGGRRRRPRPRRYIFICIKTRAPPHPHPLLLLLLKSVAFNFPSRRVSPKRQQQPKHKSKEEDERREEEKKKKGALFSSLHFFFFFFFFFPADSQRGIFFGS